MKKLIYSQEDLDLILVLELEEKDKEIERLEDENEELQQRINKAIETIKDEGLVVAIKITNGEKEQLLSSKDLLLDILKGEDKE